MLRHKLMRSGIATVLALAVPLAAAASASAALTGAGSTLVAPLEARWASDFKAKYGIDVTYGAVGSGAGIAQISKRTVDFGASDAPLTSAQAAGCAGCIQIAWALSATGIAFHINGVSKLRLSGSVLSGIYLGQITNWNDKRIKALNPGAKLPNLKITPAFRSDGSGDTYAFTDFLSRVSGAWKGRVGTATTVKFPTGVGGKGNDGVTAVVTSTNGSVGYIAASYIIAHHLSAASVQNSAGNFEFPNLKNIQQAARSVRNVPSNEELHIVNPPRKYKIAYPISTFTYVIVHQDSDKRKNLASWIYYAVTAGQSLGASLDFAQLPKSVQTAAISAVKRLQG